MTIFDVSSPLIVRDTFTLIRSMRLFGGSLNEAVLTVFVPRPGTEAAQDPNIEKLQQLNAEIVIFDQVQDPTPKTLNKLIAWTQFDYSRFEYLLWLDADIFVFEDPLIFIESIAIDEISLLCAPEFYSYMRRFPHLNETELFSSPGLPQFTLYGEGEVVPHGVCNTGLS